MLPESMLPGTPSTTAIGVDVGGTGIKAAIVDLHSGRLLSARERVDTPQPATPGAVAGAIEVVLGRIAPAPLIGVALPAVVERNIVRTAANLDPSWIGSPVAHALAPDRLDRATFLNDADAAAIAESALGAARGVYGLAVVVTLGTGIGVGLIHHGKLVPNAELGHLEIDGVAAELTMSARAREKLDTPWPEWAGQLSRYLGTIERLLWPDVFVIGGGVSRTPEPWFDDLKVRTPVRLARFANNAGIVGAALAATGDYR